MAYDFNGGLSAIALKKPVKPSKVQAPDAKNLFLHSGEDATQYQSFIEAVSDLAQAFKFLPKYDQLKYKYGTPTASTDQAILDEFDAALAEGGWENDAEFMAETFSKQMDPKYNNLIWGQAAGLAYSNLDFSPDAYDWNLLDGISTGSGQSFYQIAKSGDIANYTDEEAYNLMCSMTESKERVFSVLHDIFGDSANLTDNNAVITNISEWLGQYTEVDPHNLGILKMFFGMQTDFINTLDAYINCETYWGGDGTYNILMNKVDSYISTLSDTQKTAAESLESLWLSQSPRYDKVGETWTGDLAPAKEVSNCQLAVNAALAAYNSCVQTVYDKALAAYNRAVDENAELTVVTENLNAAIANLTDASPAEQATLLATLQDAQNALKNANAIYADFETNTSGSWVEFFCDKMDKCSADEVIRVIIANMMNRSADKKYRNDKAEYQDKKEDLIMDEIFTLRMQAKAKQNVKKIVSRNAKASVAIKTRSKASAVSRRARPAATRAASRQAVRTSAGPGARAAGRTTIKAAVSANPKHLAAGGAAKRAPSRIAGGQGIKRPSAAVGARAVAPVSPKAAPKTQAQGPKQNKDVKKVI